MDNVTNYDVHLDRHELKGRTFLLGNKRAFSVSLPAAPGHSDTALHPHKWFGVYLYGRKFLEAQLVRAVGQRTHVLGSAQQTHFVMSLTSARREYEVEGNACTEEFFVPDGVQGFACTLSGDLTFHVEPQFDMRFYRSLNVAPDDYEVEPTDRGFVIHAALPSGRYDDATETFIPDGVQVDVARLYAAVEIVGEETECTLLPENARVRNKVFRKDQDRFRFLEHNAPHDAFYDHAPLWNQNTSRVYVPVRLSANGHATVVYGFGSSKDEAMQQVSALRENLIGFQAQKIENARDILDRAHFHAGVSAVDRAYGQVLSRFMDALVARHAEAADTALDRPTTMILAGNQYFHDSWKRDENIALGVLLALGFYDLAHDVVRDTWQLQDEVTGRLPQRIRAGEDPPYHSSDGSLWALWRLLQYWHCTGDESLLRDKMPMVIRFFDKSVSRVRHGMLPSGRTQAPDYLWETWMDTPHTPRDGFPVEIQMLWIACLRNYRPILKTVDPELESRMAVAEGATWEALRQFNVRGIPADSLDDQGVVRDFLTPNPYFCFGVGLDLGVEVEGAMRSLGRRQFAGQQGIITLAPEDWSRVFSPEFLNDRRNVRGRRMNSIGKFNYHRGVEWNWLSQFFVQAELKYADPNAAYKKYLRGQVESALDRAGVGGISELHDLSGTRGPEFQAWSMAGFLEALHCFAGVHIDVPGRRISIEPQIPESWPHLQIRKWYGNQPFDVCYADDGRICSLAVDIPWGEVPEAELNIVLTLPNSRTIDFIDVKLDGVSQSPEFNTDPVPGTSANRVHFTFPARASVRLIMGSKRSARRVSLSA